MLLRRLAPHNAGVRDVVRGEDVIIGGGRGLLNVAGQERGLFWHPYAGGVPGHRGPGGRHGRVARGGRGEVCGSPGGRGRGVGHVGVLLGALAQLQHPEAGLGAVVRVRGQGLGSKATFLQSTHDPTRNHQQTHDRDQDNQYETEVPGGICNKMLSLIVIHQLTVLTIVQTLPADALKVAYEGGPGCGGGGRRGGGGGAGHSRLVQRIRVLGAVYATVAEILLSDPVIAP